MSESLAETSGAAGHRIETAIVEPLRSGPRPIDDADTAGVLAARGAFGRRAIRVAASCLLQPSVGDVVLVAVPPEGEAYVLAVLEVAAAGPVTLRAPGGDVRFAVPEGSLSFVARDGLACTAGGAIDLSSSELNVDAREARMHLGQLLVAGREVAARFTAAKGVFDVVETTAERLTQRLGRAYRFVRETDLTRAREVDTRAEATLTLEAREALVTAKRLVKLDGEQIHLG